MADIISLAQRKLENDHHLSGPAVCMACKHEWEAVVPVGTIELECPNCHIHKGLLKYGCEPTTAWVCGCGCHVFMLSGESHEMICWNCGQYQKFS